MIEHCTFLCVTWMTPSKNILYCKNNNKSKWHTRTRCVGFCHYTRYLKKCFTQIYGALHGNWRHLTPHQWGVRKHLSLSLLFRRKCISLELRYLVIKTSLHTASLSHATDFWAAMSRSAKAWKFKGALYQVIKYLSHNARSHWSIDVVRLEYVNTVVTFQVCAYF